MLLWLCQLSLQASCMCDYTSIHSHFLHFSYHSRFVSSSQRMHTTRSPSSIPTGVSGDALDLSLSGSQLSMSKRPSSASPGKYFTRSVSVSVASDSRGKRNTTLVRGRAPSRTLATELLQIVYEFSHNLFKMQEWCCAAVSACTSALTDRLKLQP